MANTIDDKINSYILANPQLRTLPEEKIISIMVEKGVITKAEAQKVSAFARTEIVKSDKGITLERQIPEKTSAQPITAKTDFTEEQAQDFSIDMIAENALNAEDLLNNIHNGTITQGYDNLKNFFNTELSSNNVKDVINYEKSSTVYLQRAKSGTLTKKDYIKENKGRISDMLLERLEREDKESGLDFIDKNRGNIAREDYKQLLKKEIDRRINQIRNIEDLKKFQLEIIALTDEQENQMLQNIAIAAIENGAERPKDMGPVINMDLTPLEDTVPADELMDFETTYKYERDTDFSEKYMEELAQSKGEMNLATGAYNKTQILKNKVREMEENYSAATKVYMSPDGIATGGGEPSPETRAMEAAEFFTEYYKAAPQNAQKDLSAIIKKQNLDIDVKLDDNGSMSLNFGELYKTDYEKNKALNTLLKVSVQEQEKRLNGLLGGKSYESYLEKYQTDYKNALGERNATAMAEAFKEDQLTIIDSVTGTTSLTGMGVMAVGGILTLTPAAPAGVVLMSAGGKIALGGMASRHILGFSDEFSKDEQSQERLNRMYKDLALDLGGLIIGGAAGRQGLKFASQIVRNGGNKALAIVVEKGTDFTLSAAGDLAMIGALHYDQGLEQTLKANGIGILVSTLTGIKASKELFKGDFPTDIQPHTEPVTVRQESSVSSAFIPEEVPVAQKPSLTAPEQGVTVINPSKIQAEEQQKLNEACTVNGRIKPELQEAAEILKKNGTTNGGAAQIISRYKDSEGNLPQAVFDVGAKLKAANLAAIPSMIDACIKPDGSVNESAIDAAANLKTQGATLFSIPTLLKVSMDSDGNFSKELLDKYVTPLMQGQKVRSPLDGAGQILEQCLKDGVVDETLYAKALELNSRNYDTTTIKRAIESVKDADGNFNEHNYAQTNKLLNSGLKQNYLAEVTQLIKKDGLIDEALVDKVLQLKEQGIKDYLITAYLKAASDKDGNFSEALFSKLNELTANPATKERASWILSVSKNKNGEFVEQNYNAVKFLFENLPKNQHKFIPAIAANSADENGNINKTYFTNTLKLFSKKFDRNSINLIMKTCKTKDADGKPAFTGILFDRTLKLVDEMTKESKSPVSEVSLTVEGNKVAITCKYQDASTKTRKLDLGVNDVKSNETTRIQNTTKEKVRVTKSHDAERNISSRTTQALDKTGTVLNETNIIRDKDGNIIRTEYYSQSDVPGILDVRVKTPDGKTKVISSGKVDPETGFTLVEKNMESLDGTVTQYRYEDDPQGNRIIDYKITDKDGNVLMNDSQTFEVISDTKMISSYNDNVYEITLDGNKLTVNGKTTGEEAVFELDTYLSDKSNKEMLLNLLKQMPGHELINLNKKVKTLSSTNDKISSKHIPVQQSIITGNDISVLLHEAGHSKHSLGAQEVQFNDEFMKIFDEEREAFIKAFPDQQQKHLEYFLNEQLHIARMRKQGTYEETVAETNSLLNTYYHSPELQIRAQYLQQYFPRTIAELSKIMQSKDTDLVTPTGRQTIAAHAALAPDEFNTKLLDMDENTFKDELINFVVTLRRKGNETVTNEEIIEFRNSEELDEFYKLYSQVPEVFAILMKKDINGEYVYSNVEKADFMLCRFDDFENANPKELLEEVQLAEKFYNYFDDHEKYPAETLGLGERQNALLKKLESEITDPIDVYDMNRIIDTIVNLRKDRDFDYYEKLNSSQIYQSHILTTVKRLKTDEQRDMFDKILTQTKSWESDYITAVEMATTHDIPHLKEYISRILAQENPKLLERELSSLYNMRYSDTFKERSYLLKDERLNMDNIKSLCYIDLNKYENNVINRKLLEDKTLTGDQIVRLANATDKYFDAYNKLKNTNLSKEDAIYVANNTYRIDEIIEDNDYLLNMNLTKDDWIYVAQRVYTSNLSALKARTELQDPSLNLTIVERIDLAQHFSTPFTDGQYTAMLERGLLQDKSLTGLQIRLLATLPDTEYALAKERDILHNVNENDFTFWILDVLVKMDDETYNNYLDIQNNPTENMKKRGLTFDEKRILADWTKEELASIDEYLYFENRVVDQFNLNDCKELSRNIDIRKNVYPEESVTAAKSAIKQLADNKTLAEQKQLPLSVVEILQLMDGDGINTEVLNLVTHEGRNSSGADRLSAKNAKDLYEMTQQPNGSAQKYTPEQSAEQRELLEKLIYIPERGSAQIEPGNLSRIMAQLGSVENFEKHKDFIYNADRAAHNIPQWNGNDIFNHIMYMPDEWLPKAKPLMYIAERGQKQFNSDDIRRIASLEEVQLRDVEKYIKNPNFNSELITKITAQNESVRAKLDEISGYNYQANVLIAAAKLDDECFNNFKTIAESAIIKNDATILECASLKGEKFKQLTELMQIEKAYNQTYYFKEIASLDSEQFAIAKQLLENGHHGGLALTVAKCKDTKILEKYDKAIEEAKKKRNQLKSGVADLTDRDIDNFFNKNMASILMTIDMVGLPAFTHSYTSKLTGVESFVQSVHILKQNLSAEDFADLEARINDKSLEPQEKIAKLRTLGVILNTYTNPQEFISLIKPNTPSKDEIQKAKAIWANPKAKFDDKLNEFCETFGLDKDNKKVVEFFNKRAQTNAKGYKILNGVKESELAKLLEIEVVRKRNEHEWNTAIDKKVYEKIGVTYTPELSRRLNLADNKYLSTFFHANSGFKENFGEMVDHIVDNPDKSIREIFDELPQNIETQRQFEKYGIDYDKWVSANKDSYLVVEVEASAQKSRQAAIANLEADLNDPDFKAIPKEETDKIYKALEEIGVTTKTKKEPRYDEDGFIRGYDDITRLYVNDKPITFNKLEKALSAIKQVINENDFWTKTNSDPAIDQARTTIYNHIMKLRDAEVDAASNLKDDELATLEVHKTDMNNISHSLFLGNHAGCCTAVGSSIGNDYAAPRYIMDKCISAIEVMDGKEFVGNTMCYFAEVDGKLALVLDNIEMSAKYQNNDKIRDVFMDYAKQLCEEVGKPDLPIYAGPYRHKFNMSPYTMDSHDLKIIGSTDGEDTYIDFAGRYVIDGEKVSRTNLYKIR